MSEIAVVRILGNDLPPRHAPGQTLENLRFMLEHEPPLAGAVRLWVVNRIADRQARDAVTALLTAHGEIIHEIPFDAAAYRAAAAYRPGRTELYRPPDTPALREHHARVLYAINCNGARNVAIELGRETASWVLPLDGNCIFSGEGWQALRGALEAASPDACLVVPMYRLLANDEYAAFSTADYPEAEPQLAFGPECEERFDEDWRYGYRSKMEVFMRLGMTLERSTYGSRVIDADRRAGHVLRLFSGVAEGEGEHGRRAELRDQAIDQLLRRLEEIV
ncbi:MAG: hypothetical protein AAGE01_12820 [Pseudomonadota bacterium]